jgi:hypothetical protein
MNVSLTAITEGENLLRIYMHHAHSPLPLLYHIYYVFLFSIECVYGNIMETGLQYFLSFLFNIYYLLQV